MIPEELRRQVVAQFRLTSRSAHDPEHWHRVEKYAVYLAKDCGADELVVRLFALLHDSQRRIEGPEPEHGPRAAAYARELHQRKAFDLTPHQLTLLTQACHDHENGRRCPDPTIGTCWDADRLDLDRVGITCDPDLMSTLTGRVLSQKRPWDRQKIVGIVS